MLGEHKCSDEAVEVAVETRYPLCRTEAREMDLENNFGNQMKEQEKEHEIHID